MERVLVPAVGNGMQNGTGNMVDKADLHDGGTLHLAGDEIKRRESRPDALLGGIARDKTRDRSGA